MKFCIFTFVASTFVFQALAHANSAGLFPSQKKGIVIIQNGKTADADFFWNIFSVVPIVSGAKYTKSFESAHGDFKAVCSRADTIPLPATSCTLTFESVGMGGVVTVSKDEGRITGVFSDEVARAFMLPQELVSSPDGLMTFCSTCGMGGAALPFSITWQK